MDITLGSDPEVFLKKELEGKLVYFPAVGVIPGDKDDPHPIDDQGRNILVDNVMLEFNTLPTTTEKGFVKEHNKFLGFLQSEMLKEDCIISTSSFVEFEPRFLQSESAKEFGCDPDFNAYSLKENVAPTATVNTRSAAGHIHIGYDGHNFEKNIQLIKLLDLTLGLQSVIDDKDRSRRKMYGKAGAFRLKDFGFEYRVLSNYWIFEDKYLKKVFNGVHKAFELFDNGFQINDALENDMRIAIDNYDLNLSKKIINEKLKTNVCVD
jgi:hypothetical protein